MAAVSGGVERARGTVASVAGGRAGKSACASRPPPCSSKLSASSLSAAWRSGHSSRVALRVPALATGRKALHSLHAKPESGFRLQAMRRFFIPVCAQCPVASQGKRWLPGPACSSRRPVHRPASSSLLFWGCLSSSGASPCGVSAGQKIASALAYLTGRPKTTVTVKRGAPEGPGAGPRNALAGIFPEITMRTREVARKGRAISAQAGW